MEVEAAVHKLSKSCKAPEICGIINEVLNAESTQASPNQIHLLIGPTHRPFIRRLQFKILRL